MSKPNAAPMPAETAADEVAAERQSILDRLTALEERLAPPPADPDPLAGLKRGRIVYYHPLSYEVRNADPGPYAAIVTNVGPQPGQVTLNVQMPVPLSIGLDPVARRTEVPHAVDESQPEPGSWTWPAR